MAKVKGPLFSLGARGQIAKTLVYMSWKGIDDVREYVIPANPKTDDQKTQRGLFSDAVYSWHTHGFTAIDVKAWNLLAVVSKVPMSGFNIFVQLIINGWIAVKDWRPLFECLVTAEASDGAQINITSTTGQTIKLYWGTSKTSMFTGEEMINTDGDCEVTLSDCPKSTKIYFYIKDESAENAARTGIYSFETTA